MADTEALRKICEKIKGMRVTLFVTLIDASIPVARPMSTQDVEFDGSVWFMTTKDSAKVAQIQQNPNVGLMYGDGSIKFVALSGRAELVEDRAKIHEFWNDFYKAWFTGEDDPNIQLVKVNVLRAEYWDHPGGKIGALADMAGSAVTGKAIDNDEHGVINL